MAALLLVNVAIVSGHGFGPAEPPGSGAGDVRRLVAQEIEAGFTYGPGVTPQDRAVIDAAVTTARPEAQRLIALVDGLTTIHVGGADHGAAGTARHRGDRYEVNLELGRVRRMGTRGFRRLVLHELAHVIDFALVPDDLLREMDAGIPAGWGCEGGRLGSCAPPEERFAETFAKWATGDIGVDLYIGYKVPPPSIPLDAWGAPLLSLRG